MGASIGKIASPSQGVSYYEKDGYYARDDPAHRKASAWAVKGAEALGSRVQWSRRRSGGFSKGRFRADAGWGARTSTATSTTGRAVTLSAPKSVSLLALMGGDERIVAAHDRVVGRTLAWVERNAVETRMQDRASGALVRVGDQKMVAATFRHGKSYSTWRATVYGVSQAGFWVGKVEPECSDSKSDRFQESAPCP